MRNSSFVLKVLLLCSFVQSCFPFYLPGVTPREYEHGETVPMKVNKLTSTRTHLPYDYYKTLPFCRPDSIMNDSENLGEVMSGDVIHNTAYNIRMGMEERCKLLCKAEHKDKDIQKFKKMIKEEYHVNWIIDNLPSVWLDAYTATIDSSARILTYEGGFPLGTTNNNKVYLYNHVRLLLKYHTEPTLFEGKRIVGFVVAPFSIEHSVDGEGEFHQQACSDAFKAEHGSAAPTLELTGPRTVFYTYDVEWEYSEMRWASRWDVYLSGVDAQVHWFSIVNSMVIVFMLTGLVAMIMNRTLHRDIDRYNMTDLTEEDALDESGWKSLHGDVFRPPRHSDLLAVCIGTGSQLLAMFVFVLGFALLGFLSPANRGGLMTAMLILFALMGVVAGYSSARMYKTMLGKAWWPTAIKTALVFPGIVFSIFFVLNLLIWGEKSSGAVRFTTLLTLLALWFCLCVPLVLLGSHLGYTRPAIEPPKAISPLPRDTVPQATAQKTITILLGGILPFGVVFIEVFFILSSIWLDQYYYAFFFLFVVLMILCITCAEISIVLCYFQLCRHDYRWWWQAFLCSGSSGIYLFLYSLYYLSKLQFVRVVSSILFVGYMFIASLFLSLATGVVGFFATFVFVRSIYSAVRVD